MLGGWLICHSEFHWGSPSKYQLSGYHMLTETDPLQAFLLFKAGFHVVQVSLKLAV